MKKLLGFFLFCYFILFWFVVPGLHAGDRPKPDIVPGKYIVKYPPPGSNILYEGTDFSVVTLPPQSESAISLSKAKIAGVKLDWYIEPAYRVHISQTQSPRAFNDPYYQYQWLFPFLKLDQIAQPSATSKPIIIAILDTGLDIAHLVSNESITQFTNKYSNPAFYNDTHGYDFTRNSSDYADDHGHGSAIASIIAAKPNNNYGIAGINNNVQIWPLKVLDAEGWGDTGDILVAMQYIKTTISNNFPNNPGGFYLFINMSFGGADYSGTFQAAVTDIHASFSNSYILAASGNDGSADTQYPAGYTDVLSIGSCNDLGNRSYFSTHGSDLYCIAPGEAIPVVLPNQTIESWDGTSFSCPVVIGLFSLLVSQCPDRSRNDILSLFKNSCSLGNLPAKTVGFGWGYPDIKKAIDAGQTIPPNTPAIEPNDNRIHFFPNPIKTGVQGYILSKSRVVKIYDILGHLIDEFSVPNSIEQPYPYSIKNFEPGIYYMIDADDYKTRTKFMVYK